MTSINTSTATNDRDYNNARPLDVHTWSDHPEVNAFVNETFTCVVLEKDL